MTINSWYETFLSLHLRSWLLGFREFLPEQSQSATDKCIESKEICCGLGLIVDRVLHTGGGSNMVPAVEIASFPLQMCTPLKQQALLDEKPSPGELGELPADFLALILSYLPPRGVARAACVSKSFHTASTFDSVWENVALTHLPIKFKELLARDPAVRSLASKRELFEYLCGNRMFFANQTQGFWLERETGGVCLGIPARALYIEHGGDDRFWSWLPDDHNSLFPEVAELKDVCWFEAKGETECTLPPGTYTLSYRVLFRKLRNWSSKPVTFTMCKNDGELVERQCFLDPRVHQEDETRLRLPTVRAVEHGWREFDVGEFEVGQAEEAPCLLQFAMTAVEEGQPWKSGICLDGVVVRPSMSLANSVPESRDSFIRFLEMNDEQFVYRQRVYNHRFRR